MEKSEEKMGGSQLGWWLWDVRDAVEETESRGFVYTLGVGGREWRSLFFSLPPILFLSSYFKIEKGGGKWDCHESIHKALFHNFLSISERYGKYALYLKKSLYGFLLGKSAFLPPRMGSFWAHLQGRLVWRGIYHIAGTLVGMGYRFPYWASAVPTL